MDDRKQDLSVTLAELLDDGGRLAGSACHNMVRFLHGGWLLFGILFGNRILSKPAPPPPTNLQLSPGRHLELVERALLNSSKSGDIVADLFGGSGSTLIGCERRERHARLMEIDPKYADCIIRRYQEYTGKKALLDGDGSSFEEVALERAAVLT